MKVLIGILIIIVLLEGIYIRWLTKNREKKQDIDTIVQFFRELWGKFVLYVLATSIIGLFLGSIFFKKIIGLNEINTWVGIVLGLVALVIGIISLFLSFYNLDQANETQEKTVEIMNGVKNDIEKKLFEMDKTIVTGFEKLHNDFFAYTDKDKSKIISSEKEVENKDWESVNEESDKC